MIIDGTGSTSVTPIVPSGFFMAGNSTSIKGVFVAHITSTFTTSWEISS